RLGTAVLGAVMASTVSSALPGNWSKAGPPTAEGAQGEQPNHAAPLGIATPAPHGTPEQAVHAMADAVHTSFVSGMSMAFAVAAVIAFAAALLGLLSNRGARDAR
ncbi:hypothetical protein, partial [Saccharothrix sp. ST-888]|uniref:hypothetical protein n=1 Tax=Saccharothrix sp. ST-888 TaxID=1427391 RepID=UPI0005EC2710